MFFLEPRSPLPTWRRGSPRMFRVDLIEKYLSRVKPWHVVLIWGPALAWFLFQTVRDPTQSKAESTLLFFSGVLGWTLLEYLLHRWVFHFKASPDSEVQQDLAFLIHGIHHDYPYDPDRLVMPPLVTAIIALLIGLPLHALLGPRLFHPAFAGLLAGYLWYDLTHYALHHARFRGRMGRWLREYHMRHHFKTPEQRFGVTTPLWDLVFGTYPRKAAWPGLSNSIQNRRARPEGRSAGMSPQCDP
jgi:dihydroceramide fatty acyl 2-hydroxylase